MPELRFVEAATLETTPSTIAGSETKVLSLPLTANQLWVGSTFHVEAHGIISATANGTALGRLRCGTNNSTADTQVCATAAIGTSISSATGWMFEGSMTVRSLGSGGTGIGQIHGVVGTANVAIGHSTGSSTFALNTTVDTWLSLTLIGGGTLPVITVTHCTVWEDKL